MAVFGGLFGRKPKPSTSQAASSNAPRPSTTSPTSLKKTNPSPAPTKTTSPSKASPRQFPSCPDVETREPRGGGPSRSGHEDEDEDDGATGEVGEYVLPPIDSLSLMNGLAQSDYFSSVLSGVTSSSSLVSGPSATPQSAPKLHSSLLPSLQYSPTPEDEEESDNRPLGKRRQLPPGSGARHKRNSSSSDTLSPSSPLSPRGDRPSRPFRDLDVASARSLPSEKANGKPATRRPPVANMLSPRPNPTMPGRPASPAGTFRTIDSSSSNFPGSPASNSTRPTSPLSSSTHATGRSKLTRAPLIKLASREPLQLNTDSESKSKERANPTIANKSGKSKEKDKSGGGMFSFIRDRKKSTAASAAVSSELKSIPYESTRPSMDLLDQARPSMSSSKSESTALGQLRKKNKSQPLPPPMPPLPSSDSMPPLRPIPVGEEFTRPSVVQGFVPPVRRQRLAPSNPPSNTSLPTSARTPATAPAPATTTAPAPEGSETPSAGGKTQKGTFELVSFRHVRPVSPGPANGMNGARSVSPGPFQGLELDAVPRTRPRQDSMGSDISVTRTTVAAFRQAQQRRGTTTSLVSDPRSSTGDLLEGGRPSSSMDGVGGKTVSDAKESQTFLPLPGPPPPAPLDLPEPIRPFIGNAAGGGRSPRGSFDNIRAATPTRPLRTNPPSISPPKQQTQSAYGQLYSASTTDESESEEDGDDDAEDESDDDDVPLGGKTPEHVSRKTTITQRRTELPAEKLSPNSTLSAGSSTARTLRSIAESSSSGTITTADPFSALPRPRPPKKDSGMVVPPPRSSSLLVDTTTVKSATSQPQSAGGQSIDTSRALSMFSDLANYAASKASKSLSAVNLGALDTPFTTARKTSGPPMAPRLPPPRAPRHAKHSEPESTEEETEESSSDEDDDNAPLGLIRRPGSAMSLRSHMKATAAAAKVPGSHHSDMGHGSIKSALKKPASSASSPSSVSLASSAAASLPSSSSLRPPRVTRRPPPPVATHSTPASSTTAKAASNPANSRSLDSLPKNMLMRPFAMGAAMSSVYMSSPNGSSNGDSLSSSGRLPLTPRDGSDLGTTSGSSALGGQSQVATTAPGGKGAPGRNHGRKGSVTFEEPEVTGAVSQEHRRKERRRSEAKNAIQIGNAINGPPPKVSDDEEPLYSNKRGPQVPHMPVDNAGMNMGWDPQLMMMLQAQQQQLVAMQAQMARVASPDAAFMNAHQQAMFYAKQAYQLTVAQQAMEAAGDEWERSSNIGGPAPSVFGGGSSVYGGGGGSVLGGMGGMGNMASMGMPMGMMGMGMNQQQMMGMMGMPGMPMMFPPPAPSSVYAASTSRSMYGGGNDGSPRAGRPNFPSSASTASDSHPEPTPSKSRPKQRTRTNTAPSDRNFPAQHSSNIRPLVPAMPPPSSWRT